MGTDTIRNHSLSEIQGAFARALYELTGDDFLVTVHSLDLDDRDCEVELCITPANWNGNGNGKKKHAE